MSAHTALAEVTALMQNAGVEPDTIVKFNGLLQSRSHLRDWLDVPNSDRTRFLAEHGQQAAISRRNAGGPPR